MTFYRLQNRKYGNWKLILCFHGYHHFDSLNSFSERLLIQIRDTEFRSVHSLVYYRLHLFLLYHLFFVEAKFLCDIIFIPFLYVS